MCQSLNEQISKTTPMNKTIIISIEQWPKN
jgi:hypothetical protein